MKYDIYLAGPLFDELDIKELEIIEKTCKKLGLTYFSPRLETNFDLKTAKNRDLIATKIVNANEEGILNSKLVLANTRGLKGSYADSGTMYEIGYAVGKNIPVATYTFNGFGLNIMISQRSIYHFTKITHKNTKELELVLPNLIKAIDTKYHKNKRTQVLTEYSFNNVRKKFINLKDINKLELY